MTPEEHKAYQKGYAAGQRRKRKQITAEQRWQRECAAWHKYMAAALSGCIPAQGWKREDNKIVSLPDRTELAAEFADEAVQAAKRRGWL